MADLEYDDDTRRSPEEIREYLEENGVPQDIIEPVVEHLRNNETAKSLGVRQVDGYLASQRERLAKLHAEEEHEKDVEKLAASTLASVEGSDSEEILDSVIYDEEGH